MSLCPHQLLPLHDVADIESGRVPAPCYPDSWPSSSTYQPPNPSGRTTKNGTSWTLDEHILFLVGVEIHGKGKWKMISKNVVTTKSANQVASHAQKFYIRQSERATQVKKRRASIHDFTLADINPNHLERIISSITSSPDHHHHHQYNPQIPSNPNLMHQSNNSPVHYHLSLNHQSHDDRATSLLHNVLPLNQSLGNQIPLKQTQIHYDPPLNHQLGAQIPSSLQSHDSAISPIHHFPPLNHLGTHQSPLNQTQLHYDLPLNHHSLPMMNESGSQSPPNQTRIHYDLPLNHHLLPMNQLGSQIPLTLQPHDQATSMVHDVHPMNQLGTQMPLDQTQSHYDISLPLNQLGTQMPLDQTQNHYDLPLPMNQSGTQIPLSSQSHQDTLPIDYVLPMMNPSLALAS